MSDPRWSNSPAQLGYQTYDVLVNWNEAYEHSKVHVDQYMPYNSPDCRQRCTPDGIDAFTTFFDVGARLAKNRGLLGKHTNVHLYQKIRVSVRGIRLVDM